MKNRMQYLSYLFSIMGSVFASNVFAQDGQDPSNNLSFTTDLSASITQYERLIQDIETSSGPLAPELAEELMGLGLLYKGLKRDQDASDTLQRSLQIIRTNQGLESMAQVDVLKDLIEINSRGHLWENLDQNYHQLYWIYKRNLEADDPVFIDLIDNLGRWKMEAYNRNLLDDSPHAILNDAVAMFRSTVKYLEKTHGESSPNLITPLNGLAYTGYVAAIEVMNTPVDRFMATGSEYVIQTICTTVIVNGRPQQVCRSQEVPNPDYYASKQRDKNNQIQRETSGIKRSLEHIVRIYEANPELPKEGHAEALAKLGDYSMLFTRSKSSAFERYREAYAVLLQADNPDEKIQQIFGKPRRLPALNSALDETSIPEEIIDPGIVKVSLDVTKKGQPRNVSLVNRDQERSHVRLLRRVKNFTFRPRIVDGEAVDTVQMNLTVRIAD